MLETLLRLATDEWAAALEDLKVEPRGSVVVLGEGADRVAEALQRIGSPWVLTQTNGFAMLDEAQGRDVGTVGGIREVADGSADLVVALRAWPSLPGMLRTLTEAGRVLRPGGAVLAGDVDFHRLRWARPDRYVSAALYRVVPRVGASLAPRFVEMLDLTMGVNRAGFRRPAALSMDRSMVLHAGGGLADAASGWRGFDLLTPTEAAAVGETLADVATRGGTGTVVVEREPWNLVAGRKPAAV